MTRAILEGVAFGLRDSLEIIKGLNIPVNEVRVSGGGAKVCCGDKYLQTFLVSE